MEPNIHLTFPKSWKKEDCVLVMSGGQDSTTCLGVALEHFNKVHCIAFSYGQKHTVEIMCAAKIINKYENVTLKVIDLDPLRQIGNSALIAGTEQTDVSAEHSGKPGLPASYVPNRNATFLTLSHAYAQKVGAKFIMTGVCETDYSGYPDCRLDFIISLQGALNLGSESNIQILTPLMKLDKADTFKLAEEYNILDTVLNMSHTCYNGDHTTSNEWGHGCGQCPACELRANGWKEFLERY